MCTEQMKKQEEFSIDFCTTSHIANCFVNFKTDLITGQHFGQIMKLFKYRSVMFAFVKTFQNVVICDGLAKVCDTRACTIMCPILLTNASRPLVVALDSQELWFVSKQTM